MSKQLPVPTPEDLDAPRSSVKAPLACELVAYRRLLEFAQIHQRAPSELEALPLLRGLGGRWDTAYEITPGKDKTDPGAIYKRTVSKKIDRLCQTVAGYLQNSDRVEAIMAQLADDAMAAAAECLAGHGRWDDRPKLLKEKMDGALALLRVAGLSKDQKGGGARVAMQTNVHFGAPPAAGESDEVQRLRAEVYASSSAAERMGLKPAGE